MNIITGYRGEPHITSSQDRARNQGMYGAGSYIMNVGRKLQAQVISANEVRIRDGVLSHQGCVAIIENGAYDSLEISNGSQGMQRRDLIVARYTKDAETNIEDISLVVIEGTPASSNPVDPSYNTGNIQDGDSPVDMPLYRVNINGVSISGTTRLASYVQTQAEADAAISVLNNNLFNLGSLPNNESPDDYYEKDKAGIYYVGNNPNFPSPYGTLCVFGVQNGLAAQLYIQKSNMYFRGRSGNPITWGDWHTITYS